MKKGKTKARLLIIHYYGDDETIWFDTLRKRESMHKDNERKEKLTKDEDDRHYYGHIEE
jgi:hypothetical protein